MYGKGQILICHKNDPIEQDNESYKNGCTWRCSK